MLSLLNKIFTSEPEGLSNKDLEIITKKCIFNFIGVFPSDSTPSKKLTKKNFSLIFNLSPHNESGTHFIAVVKRNKTIYYFDSLNEKKNKNITKFIYTFNIKIKYCTKKIQSIKSIFCGFFCLAFLLHMQKKNSTPNQFYKYFPTCNKKNDVTIKKFIIREIKKIDMLTNVFLFSTT